jgi:hypothetical protein
MSDFRIVLKALLRCMAASATVGKNGISSQRHRLNWGVSRVVVDQPPCVFDDRIDLHRDRGRHREDVDDVAIGQIQSVWAIFIFIFLSSTNCHKGRVHNL